MHCARPVTPQADTARAAITTRGWQGPWRALTRGPAMGPAVGPAVGRAMGLVLGVALAGLLGAGCASAPPDRLVHLPATPAAAPPPPSLATAVWLVQYPVKLPDYLDRDALLLREGQAGLRRLPGYRWAEPLRDSVPRLLRADLAQLLGQDRVWTTPLPAGVQPTHQLRLEVLGFEADQAQARVTLQARWSLARADGSRPPQADAVTLQVPVQGTGADALAAAHRQAVWRLAERLVTGR